MSAYKLPEAATPDGEIFPDNEDVGGFDSTTIPPSAPK